MITGILSFLAGALVALVVNRYWPERIDKLTRETEDEINDRLRGDK